MFRPIPRDAPRRSSRRRVNLASFRANGTKNLQIEAEKRLAKGGHVNGRLCTGQRFIRHNAFLAWMR
jgi:hypothetical protein